jgi:hypothetical protein
MTDEPTPQDFYERIKGAPEPEFSLAIQSHPYRAVALLFSWPGAVAKFAKTFTPREARELGVLLAEYADDCERGVDMGN